MINIVINICYESILINTMNYHVLNEIRRSKGSKNMILRNYFLKHVVMISDLEMKNLLIQQVKLTKKNRLRKMLRIYHQCHH